MWSIIEEVTLANKKAWFTCLFVICKFIITRCGDCVCYVISFLIRSLTFGIFSSTAVRAAAVAKPEILGLLPSISVILTSQFVLLTSLLVSMALTFF